MSVLSSELFEGASFSGWFVAGEIMEQAHGKYPVGTLLASFEENKSGSLPRSFLLEYYKLEAFKKSNSNCPQALHDALVAYQKNLEPSNEHPGQTLE